MQKQVVKFNQKSKDKEHEQGGKSEMRAVPAEVPLV